MNQLSEKQLSFEGAMKIVNGNKWIMIKDIEKLSDFIQEQQSTIGKLQKENNAYAEKFAKIVNLISEDGVIDDKQIEQMYLNKLDKRERQIDIMKFHILNFCTDEQIQLIRHDLEFESKLRRCKK